MLAEETWSRTRIDMEWLVGNKMNLFRSDHLIYIFTGANEAQQPPKDELDDYSKYIVLVCHPRI